MAEEVHFQQIVPGQCPPEGCPPPTRIECIVVDKVYDSCFQLDDRSQNTVISPMKDTVMKEAVSKDVLRKRLSGKGVVTRHPRRKGAVSTLPTSL